MFVELREQFTAKQFVDVIDIRSGSYQEALMKKRVLLTGIILFLVVAAGIVVIRFRKPQPTSQTNNSDTYEYYYNNEDEEEEDLFCPRIWTLYWQITKQCLWTPFQAVLPF